MRAFVSCLLSVSAFSALTLAVAPAALAECTPTQTSAADQSYGTARALGDAGQWADAIPALERALESCPEHLSSLQYLAYAQMQNKDFGPAADAYRNLIDVQFAGDLGSADVNTLNAYGYVLLNLKNWSGGEKIYSAILAQDPNNANAHERMVYLYDKSGNTQLAIPHLESLYNLNEGEAAADYAKRIGAAYKKVGQDASAKEWYGRAGGGASGQFQFGLDHMNRKEWAKAAESFENYLEGQPESVSAMKNLGLCYDSLGRKNDAAVTFRKALDLQPERQDLSVRLALALSDQEKWSEVAGVAEPAVSNWSDDDEGKGVMYYLMGKVYEKRDGDYEAAIEMFRKAQSDPQWGSFATREIDRQQQLIAIRDARKG